MKYVYLTLVVIMFALNAMAMECDPESRISVQQISQKKNPDGITQEEQSLKEEIQKISQSGVISAWGSLFEQQDIQLGRAQNNLAYCPMKLTDGREVELPIYVLPADYTLIVAAITVRTDVPYANFIINQRVSCFTL